ncbi:TraB/GumN family protein [Qipengyuania gaetbuli]|uniref:TraB/GumN family protein n=1 Tax=Qipengyuania gaetbuli TaxID=266952 RepID=UPI001CFECB20|nr:TraB/GumN family protein [Qipengyuania gaetbuli]
MKLRTAALAASSALALLALPACATTEVEPATATAAKAEPNGPAMWKVADEDTTIYLFGTVHALPDDVNWLRPDIASALNDSDTLVTEITAGEMEDPSSQMAIAAKAMLPQDQSLRDTLSDEDRAVYEAALVKLGLPPGAFDRFEPWFAGMTLAVLPLMQQGYNPESGVEKVIDTEAGPDRTRAALETLQSQIDIFDTLPADAQVEFLMSSARDPMAIVNMMDQMVAEWMEGDADDLAKIMNMGLSDPALADALLYKRNERWAQWIDERLDKPGAVFIAVGAGHLAGQKSVQDYLSARGIEVSRVR